jgi:hypothetical protein
MTAAQIRPNQIRSDRYSASRPLVLGSTLLVQGKVSWEAVADRKMASLSSAYGGIFVLALGRILDTVGVAIEVG